MLRLSGALEPLFLDWLQRELPDRAGKIINRIKDVRNGSMNDTRWGKRMKGEGEIAGTIKQLFRLNCEKFGLNKEKFEFSADQFRREVKGQIEMFT